MNVDLPGRQELKSKFHQSSSKLLRTKLIEPKLLLPQCRRLAMHRNKNNQCMGSYMACSESSHWSLVKGIHIVPSKRYFPRHHWPNKCRRRIETDTSLPQRIAKSRCTVFYSMHKTPEQPQKPIIQGTFCLDLGQVCRQSYRKLIVHLIRIKGIVSCHYRIFD